MDGVVTDVLTAEALGGVSTRCSDVVSCKAVEAMSNEVPRNWLCVGSRVTLAWLGLPLLGSTIDHLPAALVENMGDGCDLPRR